jgi:hypothetical protein
MKTKSLFLLVICMCATSVFANTLTDVRIYINPGHGGHDSDDRNITIYPYSQGDVNGFWESNSNLDKGLMLNTLLKDSGAATKMSRTTNTTADDRALSAIVAEANAFNADFMLAIHTNAGVNNYVLQLYSGWDENDTQTYSDVITQANCDASRAISTTIAQNLYANAVTCWGASYTVRGDKTFARTAMGWSNGYGVLRGLTVPGVISEGAMHDYIPETYRLMNMEYKYMEAWNFYKTFINHFTSTQVSHGVVAGSVRDSRNKILFPEFYKIKNSRDELKPLCGAKVFLVNDNAVKDTVATYTTDDLYNGFFLFKKVVPGNYILVARANDYYEYSENITVTQDKITFFNFPMAMVRNTPPEVISYSPHPSSLTDSVECAQDIVLNFNWDMDETTTREAFSITPTVEGTLKFEDSQRTLRFIPAIPFEKATHYTVCLAKTASHPDFSQPNHTMVNDFVLEFVTKNRNQLSLVTNYPQANSEDIQLKPAFFLLFDAKLTTSGIASHFIIKDESGNSITPNSRNMTNNSVPEPYGSTYFELPTLLSANTNYTLVIDATLKDQGNIPTMSAIEIPFRTGTGEDINHPVVMTMDELVFSYNEDKSRGVKAASVLLGTTKYVSGKSNQLKYSFSGDEGESFFTPKDLSIIATNKYIVGLYVFGDFSNNELYAEFSVAGDVKYAKISTLNFAGWKYQEISLANVLPADIDYQFTGLKIVKKDGILSTSGDLFVDNLMFYLNQTDVKNVELKNIAVYPNPAKDVIYVDWNENNIQNLAIYTLSGVKVTSVKASSINVATLPEGIYMLKIEGVEKTQVIPVAVVK